MLTLRSKAFYLSVSQLSFSYRLPELEHRA